MDGMQTAGIGHNSKAEDLVNAALDAAVLRDQLAIDHDELIKKRDDLIDEAKRFFDQYPDGPTNEDTASKMGDLVKDIKAWAKKAEAAHATTKRPYLDCGRVVDEVMKQNITDRLTSTAKLLEQSVGKYLTRKANEERLQREAEAERAREEARQAQEQAAREVNPVRAQEAVEKAIELADKADSATAATNASTADLSRVRGSFGSNTSLRDNWSFEVTDLMALVKAVAEGKAPIFYLQANMSNIGAAVRPKDGLRELPGVRIWNDQKAQVR